MRLSPTGTRTAEGYEPRGRLDNSGRRYAVTATLGPPEELDLSDPIDPYDMLEPERSGRADVPPPGPHPGDPSALRALARGVRRRCPRCGGRDLFGGAFRVRDRCPRCRLRLEREEGGFLGAMTINYMATTLAWLVLLAIWLVLDLPDVHLFALTAASLALVALFPLAFYRTSKTIWAAVDYLVYRSSPDYGRRDAADRAPGNGGRF